MNQLPIPTHQTVVQLPDGTHAYVDPHALPVHQAGPQVVHIHQAAPDRTIQRIALGSGMGAGTVAAGVYFGPLLVGALTAIAANLAILAFLAVALTWGVVTLVRSVGGPDGKAVAKNVRKARRTR